MTFWETLRLAVRKWLGIDDLATRNLIAALEKADRVRHAEVLEALARIEQTRISPINPSARYSEPQDWEAVQIAAMQQLERNTDNV